MRKKAKRLIANSKNINNKKLSKKKIIILIAIIMLALFSCLCFGKTQVFDEETQTTKEISLLENMANTLSYSLTSTGQETSEPRVKYNFNYDWKFSKGQGYENSGSSTEAKVESTTIPDESQNNIVDGSYVKGTNGETWESVSLPHTYNDTDTFDRYTETGSNTLNGERTMYTGTAWYEKTFYIPKEYETKKVYIEFEAARQMAEIYVNGTLVEGRSENGFIAFGYDLTKYLIYGGENRIVVKVDNSYPYYIKDADGNTTTNNVAWSDSHWHPNYGGLYRNTHIYVMDNLHLTLPLYSFTKGEGTYVYTTDETQNSAIVHVNPEIENNYGESKTFNIQALVKDASGNTVLTLNQDNITIGAGEKLKYELSGTLNNPIRWSTKYPYLYKIETQISVDGQVIDNNENELGIRTFRITNDYGFYLNENYLELNGWGQRTTNEWATLGAATPNWMQSYVIQKMKTAGANLIRWGHVSAGKAQIESSDKYGLLVIQPGVDGEGNNSSCFSKYNTDSYKLRAEAFRDMIIYFRNNPSIIMWEIGNQDDGLETLINYSDIDGVQGQGSTNMAQLFKDMIDQYDYGNRSSQIINTGSFDGTNTDSDRFVTVRQSGPSTNSLIDVAETTLGGQNNASSAVPRIESEYNRLEARRGVWDKFTVGFKNFTNGSTDEVYKDVTGEDFAVSQLKSAKQSTSLYDMLIATNYTGGGANWIFSDSISHGRLSKSEVARASGEVDAMMLEKEAYWVDKVAFSEQPSSYIVGHWNYEENTTKTIYVAAKGVETVELFINDVSKGKVVATNKTNGYLFEFPNITYEEGTISVKGYDKDGKEVEKASSSKKTHGEPSSLRITPIVGKDGVLANGSDVVLFDIEVIDSAGNRCLTYNGQTTEDYADFNINDSDLTCVWRGGYNSNIEYSTNKKNLYIESGITRVAVKTTRTPGDITLSATTQKTNLTSNIATVTSKEVPDVMLDGNSITGLSLQENSLESYSIESLSDPGYGNAVKLGIDQNANVPYNSSVLVENFSYSGTQLEENTIEESFGETRKMYSDSNLTFTDVPVKYLNSEYLLLPSQDNISESNVDLLSFTAKKDITLIILRDENTDKPIWLDDTYTKTSDEIVGGNGVIYSVYTKAYSRGSSVNIGTTSDTSQGGEKGYANIIAFKETTQLENNIFFYEDFSNADTATIMNGYNAVINANTDIVVDKTTFASDENHKEVLYFTDYNSQKGDENLAYIEKRFADMTEMTFEFSYDAYVTDTQNNEYIRTFINKDKMELPSIKDSTLIENYLAKIDNTTLGILSMKGTNKSNITENISLNNWHNYTYTIDTKNYTYRVKVDDVDLGEVYTFNSLKNIANYFVFGTRQEGNTEFYLDNIKITPKPTDIITDVIIDGTSLVGFVGDVYQYTYSTSPLTPNTNIEIKTTKYYKSHTIEYIEGTASLPAEILIKVQDLYDTQYTYSIKNVDAIDMLEGFTVVNNNGSSLTATSLEYQGENAIKLYDNIVSGNGWIYAYKTFEPQRGIFEFSYDINIPSNAMANKWNRVVLRNDVPTSLAQTNGVGAETYINKTDSNKIELSARIKDTTSSDNDLKLANNLLELGKWNKIKYLVNVYKGTYDIYIGEQLVATDITFRPPNDNGVLEEVDTMIFATGGNSTSEMYFANIKVTPIYGYPIDGINIEESKLTEFNPEQLSYTYYSNNMITQTTPQISVSQTTDFKEYRVERDVEKQCITITAINKSDEEYVYKIYVEDMLQREISVEQLQELIDNTYIKYPEEIKNEYVEKGWDNLRSDLQAGQDLIDNINLNNISAEAELSRAYYRIEKAISQLIKYKDYSYDSGNVEVVRYSEDLENLFSIQKLLENGELIYKDSAGKEVFYSIPYKLWNSEYVQIQKEYETYVGAIQFKALVDLDVYIAYDRQGGELQADGYTESGDIITSSDGTVYKLYQKHFAKDSIVTLDYDTCIENAISNKNSVVIFLPNEQANSNSFVNATASNMTTERLKKLWTVITPTDGNGESKIEIVDRNNEKALLFESTSNTSMAYMYNKFAKLTDKLSFSFSVLNSGDITGNTDNRWTRTWLLENEPKDPNSIDDDSDKVNILFDSYIDNGEKYQNDQVMLSTVVQKKNVSNFVPQTKLNFNTWNTITYNIDLKNNKTTVKNETTGGQEVDISAYRFNELNYINHVYFATRKKGNTWMYFKDISIKPITRDIITNINIDGNPLNDAVLEHVEGGQDYTEKMYHPLTKDYLYKYDNIDGITKPNNQVTVDIGESYESANITENTNYTSIVLADKTDDYTFENRVYFELKVDKSLLTKYINEAQNLDKDLYNIASWQELETVLKQAIEAIGKTDITQTDVDLLAELLRDKIDNLVYKNEDGLEIKANLYYGKDFETDETQIHKVDITQDSSITMKTRIYHLFSGSYPYKDITHERIFTTSKAFPVNTKITVMDDTDKSDIKYYYYIVTQEDSNSGKKEYPLNKFIKMGTIDEYFSKQPNYNEDGTDTILEETLSFVVDYEDVEYENSFPTAENYQVGYQIKIGEKTIKMNSQSTDNTTYKITNTQFINVIETSQDDIIAFQGEDININLSNIFGMRERIINQVTNTTLKEQKMGIVVTLLKDNTQIPLPVGITGKIETENDNTQENSVSDAKINSERKLFIPYSDTVNSILNGKKLTLVQEFENVLPSADYVIKVELLQSYNGVNYGKVMSSKDINLKIVDKANYGLIADISDNVKPTIKKGETTILPVNISKSCDDVTQDINTYITTAKLYKKNDYNEYDLIDLSSFVGDTTLISSDKINEYVLENNNTINFEFLSTLDEGTYRLEFNLYNTGDISKSFAQDVENFIVKH